MTTTIDGLASGLDTTSIIQGLLATDQQRVTDLQNQQSTYTKQEDAFKQIEANLVTLQGDVGTLAKGVNGVFASRTVTSSNQDLVTGAASSSAVAGSYTFRVNTLATAQQIASQGFDGPTSAITQGTIQVRVGSGATTTLTIDGSNDTLQGLADTINRNVAGVTASIVNDGSATQPYRLLLTSQNAGVSNAVSVTSNLPADDGSGARQPVFDTIVQQASNASVTLGSGSGALTVQSSSNQINNLINGVTLNLLGADPNQTVTIKVGNDTSAAQQAITNFVQGFNGLISNIDQQVSYDAQTNTGGVLLGNGDATDIEDQVRNLVTSVVGGLNPQANRLSVLGITVDQNGQLQLDSNKLQAALSGQVSGVSFQDIGRLFALTGQSDNNGIQFVSGDTKTKAASVQVVVTSAATQAAVTATNPLAASTTITSANNAFTLQVDGTTSGTVTLQEGTYTAAALAQEVQSEINANSGLNGRQVSVSVANNHLVITSASYGSSSQVAIGSGSALGALGFAGTENGRGQNVTGHYVVNGVTEAATGAGQFLLGNATNANTADLQVRATLTPSQVAGNGTASLTVTGGVAAQLSSLLNRLVDPVTGRLKTIEASYDGQVSDLQKAIDLQNQLIQAKQASLQTEFAAMESAVSQLKATSQFLTAQFSGLTAANANASSFAGNSNKSSSSSNSSSSTGG